ncbi:MAG: DUF2125 domain-containing protein [Hyphomonadaceae bacterium]|nr:DUF2125 domain-containing protein [Hyphomonadaceae bacterium]
MSASTPRRLGLYIPWGLFALFCLGWTGYWFFAKDAGVRAIDAAIARAAQDGVAAGYGSVRASGYPLRLTLTLTDAHLTLPAPALRFDAKELPVSINLSNPRHVIAGFVEGLSWRDGAGRKHTLTAVEAQLSMRVDDAGGLARFSLDLKEAHIDNEGGPYTRIGELMVHLRPDPRDATDAQLVVDASIWGGPTPFAALNAVSPFTAFRLAAAVTDYESLATRTPLRSWRGALRVERLDVTYAGTRVTGEGALDRDAAFRPVGRLTLRPEGAAPVDLVAGDGWWTFAGLRVAPARPLYSAPP